MVGLGVCASCRPLPRFEGGTPIPSHARRVGTARVDGRGGRRLSSRPTLFFLTTTTLRPSLLSRSIDRRGVYIVFGSTPANVGKRTHDIRGLDGRVIRFHKKCCSESTALHARLDLFRQFRYKRGYATRCIYQCSPFRTSGSPS